MRLVDEYPARMERVGQAIRACPGAEEFENQLVRHFFPEPTDWDADDFEARLRTITPCEVAEVIEDLGLRTDLEYVFQCQHCGRYATVDKAVSAWVLDPERLTGDPNQRVMVPTAACGVACHDQVRRNSYRLAT